MGQLNKSSKKTISRRKFLATAGGATFMISAYVAYRVISPNLDNIFSEKILSKNKVTVWVHIRQDGRITIFNPAAEMGQGSMTALPVIIAEEMDVDWEDVQIENSPIDPAVYGRGWGRGNQNRNLTMLTVGSYTVMSYYDSLRKAGAQARYVLLHNVARHWGVPIEELTTEPSLVLHKKSNRKVSYGEITTFFEQPDSIPEITDNELKNPEDFRIIGNKKIQRFDIPAKVDGSAKYGMDIKVSGMVYALMNRIPSHGSRPHLKNETELKQMPGIIDFVTLKHGVAVIAETVDQALAVKKKMEVLWIGQAGHDSVSALEQYATLISDASDQVRDIVNEGNVTATLLSSSKTYKADYKNDYVYHAQMEPLNAVASVASDGKSAEIWVGTQGPGGARAAAAKALGLDESKVLLHPQYLGGGFGRRSMSDNVVEAVQISKAVGRPVKLIWTREDDLHYGAFRPQSLQRMEAGIDEAGNIIAWRHLIMGPGGRLLGSGADVRYYSIPDKHVEICTIDHEIRTQYWRSVGHGPNHFAIESFIDEIAADNNMDPLHIRQKLLKNSPRALHVLNTVAEISGWGTKIKKGRGYGMAFGERSGALVAGICELSFNAKNGKIKVHKFWAAIDAGTVVQPDNVIAQMEGAILMGMSSVMSESITFKNGVPEQSNFHDYQILRIADVPESIEIKIIRSNEPPSGVGEAGLPFVGAAIANAFAMLTGKRLRHMPFNPAKTLEVLGD